MSSEDPATLQKRSLLNNHQDMDGISGLVYTASPIPRSPRKPTTHFPSSSGQTSSALRHKSPASRHLSPHRSASRNKFIHNWEDVNSIRKTQSTALPDLKNGPWPRGTTASTPDLMVEVQSVGTEAAQPGSSNGGRCGRSTCQYNLRLVFLILNCIILVSGLTYLLIGILMTIYKEISLIIVEYRFYLLHVILLYIEATVLLFLAFVELCFAGCGSRKQHVSCCLLTVILTITLGIMQNAVATNIRKNLKERMISSVRSNPDAATKAVWEHLQETFKCCGARGNLDWCDKNDVPDVATNASDFLGSFTCNFPVSCCIDDIGKSTLTEKSDGAKTCVISPTPWNTHRLGCLAYVRREIHYMGKLFGIVNVGTAIILVIQLILGTVLR